MSRKRRRVRLTLTVLFTLIVFCILTITMVLVGAITVTMRYMGLFSHLSVPNMSFLLAIVAIASVLVGTAFTAIISSIPLKPLNRLIGGMNELAGGNYQTRLYFGENKVGKEFVEKMEEGYDGYIAQGGSNLSGGQKQRLSIARAVCRHPEILIFDDSFSALDYKTDKILRQALKTECADATKLIVAQRIGTIRDADRIVVMDEGKVASIGTHEELMKNCEVYRQIAYSQLSKEELA